VLEDWMIFTGKHRAAAAADENSIYTGNEIA